MLDVRVSRPGNSPGEEGCQHNGVDDPSSDLPSGRVTFVLTDVEGSTRLLRELGDAYPGVLNAHRVLLRDAWADHGGHEIDNHGDSCLVAFDNPSDAVVACASAQRAMASYRWPSDAQVRVRMGLHAGLAAPSDGRYVALAVHQAARVSAAAHGGQVLVSEQAAGDLHLPADLQLESVGRFRVRDFDHPVHLLSLVGAGLPRSDAAPRAMPADRHNLSAPPASLIDRTADLDQAQAAVAEHRMVTLVGPGGVGKTRLAIELGLRVVEAWPDGVWFVEAGPLEDPSLLPGAVAAALGVPGEEARRWQDVLVELSQRRCLVIIDGCEHLSRATANLVSSLVASCHDIHVLVTSTEPLHIPGEFRYRLPPLPTDGADSIAARLFVDRARAAQPNMTMDEVTTGAVASLCRRLDGLPLALEIAAARTTAMHPIEILAGLDEGLRTLRVRDRTTAGRHAAMETLLDWSVGLLDGEEAATLRRLSLFATAFDVDAATAAVAEGPVKAADAPELVWSLVDKSLLVAETGAAGTRYRALETVRTHARRALESRGEATACAARLGRHYVNRLGPSRGTGHLWVSDVAAELDNVRAVTRALGSVADPSAQGMAAELACAIARHHDTVQSFRTGISEVTRLAEELTWELPERVGLLTALGDLHVRVGDATAARDCAEVAADLRRRVGPPGWDDVGIEKLQGEAAIATGDLERAIEIAKSTLARPGLSPRGRARMSNLLGIALITVGDLPATAEAFRRELEAAEQLRDDTLEVHAFGNLAEVLLRLGDVAEAARFQARGLNLALRLGQTGMVAYALFAAARMATQGGGENRWETAVHLAAKAERLLQETGLTLYETDRQVIDAFLVEAKQALGRAGFQEAVRRGRALEPGEAIRLGRSVLSDRSVPSDTTIEREAHDDHQR